MSEYQSNQALQEELDRISTQLDAQSYRQSNKVLGALLRGEDNRRLTR
ncbi:MAG: hypothetical protein ABI413_11460 [Ktedonobacteraceae bacterium]